MASLILIDREAQASWDMQMRRRAPSVKRRGFLYCFDREDALVIYERD